ncbi:hypothetical protein AAU57_08445 [Nonlabens sp. YIK11]|nr:hypothetical protein AAU57_08445 [Nonlabens sp. YIK11]
MMAQTTFDFNNSNDGFVGEFGTLDPGATASTLTITGAANENPKITNTSAGVDAANGSFAVVKLKNNSNNGYMRISYPKQPDGTEDPGSIFKNQVISTNDTEFKTYIVDVTNNQNYVGTVNTIDLIFKLDADNNADGSGGTIEIDQIQFTNNPPTPERNDYTFSNDGDVEGWSGKGRVALTVSNGNLIADYSGINPNTAKLSQEIFSVNADLGNFAHIVIQNNTINDQLRISYPASGGGRVFRTTPTTINATDFEVIDLNVSSDDWVGMVTGIELQVRQSGDNTVDPSGSVTIARIVFDANETLSEESLQKLAIGMYPNPSNGMVNFRTNDVITEVTIHNLAGQKVITATPVGNSLNISDLNPGVYIATFKNQNNDTFSSKLVKN